MDSRDRRPLLVASILLIVHTVGLVLILAEPISLLDQRPFLDQDWGLHHTHLISAEAFWRTNAQLWGYSPNYMAGFPSNTHLDASIKAFELAALFTPGVSTLQAFKLWVFMATSSIPWLCLLAVHNFVGRGMRLGWLPVLAAALVTASWWSSLGREMYFYGMVGWPVGSALALLVLSLLWVSPSQAGPGSRDPRFAWGSLSPQAPGQVSGGASQWRAQRPSAQFSGDAGFLLAYSPRRWPVRPPRR